MLETVVRLVLFCFCKSLSISCYIIVYPFENMFAFSLVVIQLYMNWDELFTQNYI